MIKDAASQKRDKISHMMNMSVESSMSNVEEWEFSEFDDGKG